MPTWRQVEIKPKEFLVDPSDRGNGSSAPIQHPLPPNEDEQKSLRAHIDPRLWRMFTR